MTYNERRLYDVWHNIRYRCKNPGSQAWADYGGRGISICEEWDNDFSAFAKAVGIPDDNSLELDRINNNGNYEPGNVRWITHKENSKNTRRHRKVTIDGVTKHSSEWCDEYGIARATMCVRLKAGWTGKKLLSPVSDKSWARKITINGVTKTAPEWALSIGISTVTFYDRLKRNLPPDQLLAPGRTKQYRGKPPRNATPRPLRKPFERIKEDMIIDSSTPVVQICPNANPAGQTGDGAGREGGEAERAVGGG